jgi:hypothetical protein
MPSSNTLESEDKMHLAVIYCEVLFREFATAAIKSPNVIDFYQMEQGLHCEPANLRKELQNKIDEVASFTKIDGSKYDAILLGYALCSNGVVGLSSDIPIIIPKGHDCVTILLGSKEKYQEYFDTHHGIYWYTPGWIERTLQPSEERVQKTREHYIEMYGEDNADYLIEMEQNWYNEYKWATYIDTGMNTIEADRTYTKNCAKFLNWIYDELKGDMSLVQDFFDGNWDNDRFLTVNPGECIEPSYDNEVLKACAGCDCHGAAQIDDKSSSFRMQNR